MKKNGGVEVANIIHTSDATFKRDIKRDSDGVVLVDFTAKWCSPCKEFEPTLKAVAAELPDVVILKADVESSLETAMMFDVMSFPTLLKIKYTDGQREDAIERKVGVQSKGDLLAWLRS